MAKKNKNSAKRLKAVGSKGETKAVASTVATEEVLGSDVDDDEQEEQEKEEEDHQQERVDEHEHPSSQHDVKDVHVAAAAAAAVATAAAAAAATPEPFISDGRYRNKQRCLVLCSRGVTARYRHLLEDLRTLMPHHKKESKLDAGDIAIGQAVNDIAEMRSCNTVLFLETRKRQDAYMWMARVGGGGGTGAGGGSGGVGGSISGPSVRFHVTNVHTMDELRLTGNCMKGSRPILSFDDSFEKVPHLQLLKELFVDIFGTPRGHPKCKPFVDRVMSFYYADKKIWVRNYQILEQQPTTALEAHMAKKSSGETNTTSLVEIGPRFVLNPIRIFHRSFGGQTLYRNEDFVSPNEIRAMEKKAKGRSYLDRKEAEKKRKRRQKELVLPDDPLDSVFDE